MIYLFKTDELLMALRNTFERQRETYWVIFLKGISIFYNVKPHPCNIIPNQFIVTFDITEQNTPSSPLPHLYHYKKCDLQLL